MPKNEQDKDLLHYKFADGKWILADPIACITETEYNPSHIQLTGKHAVGGKKEFIAYDRSLDIGHKQHQKDYNESMVKGIFNLFTEIKQNKTAQTENNEEFSNI